MPEEIEEHQKKSALDIATEPGQRKRQVAYRLRINEMNNAVVSENKAFFEIGDKKITRVNLIAIAIDKFLSEGEKRFASLTVDDGSSQIRVKTFGEDVAKFNDIEIGNVILIIGFIRYFNNEIYILPDIIKKVDEKWLLVRKYELAKTDSLTKEESKKVNREQIQNIAFRKNTQEKIDTEKLFDEVKKTEDFDTTQGEDIKETIRKILKEKEDGVDVETLILTIKADVKSINDSISELLDEATIYEPKPGFIRLL